MSTYNLNDNVNDSFGFEVGGHRYVMRYPTTEELENLQELVRQEQTEEANGDFKDAGAAQAWLYGFIEPADVNSPSIAQVMKTQNVRVLRNFKKMFEAELGVE